MYIRSYYLYSLQCKGQKTETNFFASFYMHIWYKYRISVIHV